MSLRVMVVNKGRSTADLRHAMHDTNLIPSCINPCEMNLGKICTDLDEERLGAFARYDVVVVDLASKEEIEAVIGCIRETIADQEIIVISAPSFSISDLRVHVVPDMEHAPEVIRKVMRS